MGLPCLAVRCDAVTLCGWAFPVLNDGIHSWGGAVGVSEDKGVSSYGVWGIFVVAVGQL